MVARPHRGAAASGSRSGEPATVTTETADLKREPSTRSSVIGVLPHGARVTIVADQGLWIQAKIAKGETGFVSAESLERDADKEARERRASKILAFPPVFGVVGADTVIRLAPFAVGPRSGRLARGATVSIHAVDHDYYAFRSADGGLAFVDSASVDLVSPDPRKPPIVPEAARDLKDVAVNDVAVAQPTPAASAEDGTFPAEPPESFDEALEPPVLVSKVDPLYPESARRAGVEGTVVLDAFVGVSGRVEDVQVLRGLPLGLSEAAEEAVRAWHYRPARGRSGPVASHKTVRIVFTLGPGR